MLLIGGIGLVACISAALWAFSPAEYESINLDWRPELDAPIPTSEPDGYNEQMAVFEKRLWTPPERPAQVITEDSASAPPPSPPPRLVLLGIVSPAESGSSDYEAILYDPDTDTVHIASSGTVIGSVTIDKVSSEAAVLTTPQGESMLRLDTGRPRVDRG